MFTAVAFGILIDLFLVLILAVGWGPPELRWSVAGAAGIPTLVTIGVCGKIFAGILQTMWDSRVRIHHALEHATAWILARRGLEVWSGEADRDGFRLSGTFRGEDLRNAFATASDLLLHHNPDLRISVDCGARFFVQFCVIVTTLVLLPAGLLAMTWQPRLGLLLLLIPLLWLTLPLQSRLLQRWFTTSARFEGAEIVRLERKGPGFFVTTQLRL